MVSKLRTLYVLAVFLICSGSMASEYIDGVGLYFDQAAICNCMPDSLNTYLPLYLILENPSNSSGVAGWQGVLEWDSGLFVSLISYGDGSINTMIFPEMFIGYVVPLPYQDTIVLASLMVYAINPGGLRFGPYGSAGFPYYLPADNIEIFIPMLNVYGDASEPDAMIGSTDCPELNDTQGISNSRFSWGQIKEIYK